MLDSFDVVVFDKIGAVSILVFIAIAVITDKLVWHTRLRQAEARADRWERIALEALAAGAHAGVVAAEVAVDVVSSIPRKRGEGGGDTNGLSDGGSIP